MRAPPADLCEPDPLATYELSLSPNYVWKWGFWEAVRELLQNSIDQHAVNAYSQKVLDWSYPFLTIGNTFCSLPVKTLLLGVTDKEGSVRSIGQFGEGYKLAMLVLSRLSYDVVVLNNDTVWIPRIGFSDKYDERIVTVSVYQATTPVNGVYFRIQDVNEHDFGKLTKNYLGDEPCNKILEEDHLRKRVFVKGLFVCELPELVYGYNFSPDRLRLDRDRGIAPSWEVKYEASRLWQESGDEEKLYGALKEGIPDVRHVVTPPDTTNQYIVGRFLAEHPNSIPVSSQTDMNRCGGSKTQLVPQVLRDLLRRLHKFVFDRSGTPSERLEKFSHAFGHRLCAEGQRELQAIMNASLQWAGPAESEAEEAEA